MVVNVDIAVDILYCLAAIRRFGDQEGQEEKLVIIVRRHYKIRKIKRPDVKIMIVGDKMPMVT